MDLRKFLLGIYLISLIFMAHHTAKAIDGSGLWLPESLSASKTTVVGGDVADATIRLCVNELERFSNCDTVELRIVSEADIHLQGYEVREISPGVVEISASQPVGLLYGSYALLRAEQTGASKDISSAPKIDHRILNHWDNLDGTIERGYAGHSLWQWDELPSELSPRYEQYARACASVGINGTVLNNVNASANILSDDYLGKVAALADVFRPYGLKVYLSVNFASPMLLDSLATADPLDTEVALWWQKKAKEIYSLIPDFGGFLVKANSEGQPGPCDYGRSHAQGANMLARALEPYDGIVMWRAFVYSPDDADRAKQAYNEFEPLDGQFDHNVIIQIKNGPIDFQPREPFSPLFGAMPHSSQMVEFQITQEYLGHSNHLAYLAPMWKEFFDYVDCSDHKAIAGVANIGDATNWTGHPMAQSNWYAFGRLAWDPGLSERDIAREWLLQSHFFTSDKAVDQVTDIMIESRECVVDYMMPMGLHHIFAFGHHYGPEPWCDVPGARADWLPKYYHRADKEGIGFDRSASGSNAVGQYPENFASIVGSIDTCPEKFLLWFHHVPWRYQISDGRTLWEALCEHYESGLKKAGEMADLWITSREYIDPYIYADVADRLKLQERDAKWWHDACLLYFKEFSGMDFPESVTPIDHTLDEFEAVNLGISNYEAPSSSLLNNKLPYNK